MTKAELIKRMTVAADGKLTRDRTEAFMDAVFDHIRDAVLTEGSFSYPEFGTWKRITRRERRAHNPRTNLPMVVPASRTVVFRTSEALQNVVRSTLPGKSGPPSRGVH